jgi:hypothetical protein
MENIAQRIYLLEFLIRGLRALDAAEIKTFFRRRWFELHARHSWSETRYPRDKTRGRLKLVEKRFTAQYAETDPRADSPFNWSFRPGGYSFQHPQPHLPTLGNASPNCSDEHSEHRNGTRLFGTKFGRVQSLPRIGCADWRWGST